MISMMHQYYIICRTNDNECLMMGREGPRLYLRQQNAQKQAKHRNTLEARWAIEYPNAEHLKADRLLGPWLVGQVKFDIKVP